MPVTAVLDVGLAVYPVSFGDCTAGKVVWSVVVQSPNVCCPVTSSVVTVRVKVILVTFGAKARFPLLYW